MNVGKFRTEIWMQKANCIYTLNRNYYNMSCYVVLQVVKVKQMNPNWNKALKYKEQTAVMPLQVEIWTFSSDYVRFSVTFVNLRVYKQARIRAWLYKTKLHVSSIHVKCKFHRASWKSPVALGSWVQLRMLQWVLKQNAVLCFLFSIETKTNMELNYKFIFLFLLLARVVILV
jgi:hypothetical protein